MNYPQRKSPRLQHYDYSQHGAYFVTVCVQHRVSRFGEIANGQMRLNPAGAMIAWYWSRMPQHFPAVEIDLFVVMPNHFHGIVLLDGAPKVSLSTVIQWFKTMTTSTYIRGVERQGWEPFAGKLWQRSYYDHIIRDEQDLTRIQEYVLHNPARWQDDELREGTGLT